METENIHRNWLSVFGGLLKDPRANLKQISSILSRSHRFLSIISSGGVSSSYSSYADSLRHSVEEIFKVLADHLESEDAHAGVYFILSNYKKIDAFNVLPVLSAFLNGRLTVFLVKAVERICNEESMHGMIEPYAIDILAVASKAATSLDHLVGESSVRVIFSLYKRKRSEQTYLSKLTEAFQMRYLDLFISKIFPTVVASEDIKFVGSLIQILSGIKEIPILLIAQSLSRNDLLNIPEELLKMIVERAESAQLPQEHIAGIKTVSKIPETVDTDELVSMFLKYNKSEVLYNQADALLVHIEILNGLNTPAQSEETDENSKQSNTTTYGNNFDLRYPDEKTKGNKMHSINEFLSALTRTADGTRIQFCRILYHMIVPSQKPVLLSLLKNKNIRVKWNALRTLGAYALSEEEIEVVLNLLMATENEKIKMWALKILEASKKKYALPGLKAKDTIYKEEIEDLIRRIN
ncbi:hypothetical protein NEMIN01_0397 [Nematocida minor]|uniref:uncharacterized protein n=1 Tax=Nematocida minor TaxID=1912983 RepID=UPI00221E9A1D|nr:uncharacterized protein NEMIN01_0397 [Nematocida minor]KAI5189231.1 hypothetical protein NEMIN01_0397 [Nematocida minor]